PLDRHFRARTGRTTLSSSVLLVMPLSADERQRGLWPLDKREKPMSSISTEGRSRKPFYAVLYVQVMAAIAVAIALGHLWPAIAVDMKPFGDGFIKLIQMVIALAIVCTVVTVIAGMSDMKKVSRVGGKALLYFEVVSTLALLLGFFAAHLATPGAGFNVDPATLDTKAVAQYAGKAKEQTIAEFL